jgi:hypothetical protein
MDAMKCGLTIAALALLGGALRSGAEATPAPADSGVVMPGGAEGKVFDDMTIEGEDRISIEFDRPTLNLKLDPKSAPGLDWDRTREVLERNALSFSEPLLDGSRITPYLPRPWFNTMRSGAVARFHPQVEGVERWTLTVADSRGRSVAVFEGQGKVPKEIAWDGLTADGTPAMPGLTYSYGFEAWDKAGNKRNFMGDGFELPSYRLPSDGGVTMLFSGARLPTPSATRITAPPAILLEAAGWLNQIESVDQPVRIKVAARSYEQAQGLVESVTQSLAPLVLGNPARIQTTTRVAPDAPERGAVQIEVR